MSLLFIFNGRMIKVSKHSPGGKMKKSEETRKHIISVATELFNKNGYNMTSTKALAQAMDVSEALIFKYFKSKKNLLSAIILETASQFKRESLPQIQEIMSLEIPAFERLERFLRNRYDFFITNEPVITIIINQVLFDEAIRTTINDLIMDYINPFIMSLLAEDNPHLSQDELIISRDMIKDFIFEIIVTTSILKKPCPYTIDKKLLLMKRGL